MQDDGGAKHTYYIKSFKKNCKLTDWEIEHVREQLQVLIDKCIKNGSVQTSGSNHDIDCHSSSGALLTNAASTDGSDANRIQVLEQALMEQTSNNASIREELRNQAKALDVLLAHAQKSGKAEI